MYVCIYIYYIYILGLYHCVQRTSLRTLTAAMPEPSAPARQNIDQTSKVYQLKNPKRDLFLWFLSINIYTNNININKNIQPSYRTFSDQKEFNMSCLNHKKSHQPQFNLFQGRCKHALQKSKYLATSFKVQLKHPLRFYPLAN